MFSFVGAARRTKPPLLMWIGSSDYFTPSRRKRIAGPSPPPVSQQPTLYRRTFFQPLVQPPSHPPIFPVTIRPFVCDFSISLPTPPISRAVEPAPIDIFIKRSFLSLSPFKILVSFHVSLIFSPCNIQPSLSPFILPCSYPLLTQ